MIIEDMRNTSVLGNPEEWFLSWNPAKANINWTQALEGLRKRAISPNGVTAVKVMANQLFDIDTCLSGVVTPGGKGMFPHFAETFRNAHWIRLIRHDVVAQAVSRVMARQTGINHATARPDDEHFAGNLAKGYDPNYNKDTKYQYGAIQNESVAIVLENLGWARFFESNGIKPIEFVYEEVAADADMRHLDVMAELAGISEPLPHRHRKMVKVGNTRNEEWRARFYNEVARSRFRLT